MKFPSNYIHVMLAADENYAPHLAVVLASLKRHNSTNDIYVHIVHHAVSEATGSTLKSYAETLFPDRVRLTEFCLDHYRHLRVDDHITVAAYLRLFISDIMPSEVDRVIYLDCDVVVRADIAELWRLSLDGKIMAAAPEIFSPHPERLGFNSDEFYFNSGVLLIDLNRWRQANNTAKLIHFAENNVGALRYHDQDSLNAVMRGEVRRLSYIWNFQARTTEADLPAAGMRPQSLLSARRQARIVHYTTGAKPWIYYFDVPFENEYLFYAKKTPWRRKLQADKTPKARLRRLVKRHASPLAPIAKSVAHYVGGGR